MALPARAHHLIELYGLQPSLINGLLSGLAHPLLGPDHLVFLLALSLLGLRRSLRWVLGLLAVALAGSAIGLLWPGLPSVDLLLAGTLSVEALALLGWLPAIWLVPAMALHGYALSEAVLGWSPMPVGAYLGGLLLSQGLLLVVALRLLRPIQQRLSLQARRFSAVALIGLSLLLGVAAGVG